MRITAILSITAVFLACILFYFINGSEKKLTVQDISKKIASTSIEMSSSQLKEYDGTNGKQCYVAVNGKVYNIPLDKTSLWLGGKHIPSGGMAMCGRDLSTVIGSSPHGVSKLDSLNVVANYKP